jgi:hypothetical protein
MRRVLLIFLLATLPWTSSAQSPTDRDAVLKTIKLFFDTMAAKDVEGARKIMVPEGRFYAMDMLKATMAPASFTSEEYFVRLQQNKQTLRERIWNPEVRVHRTIATVWAPYDFWIDGKFSHCGVDAFDLIKAPDGWKIAGGAFTMEAKCEPSPLGPLTP